METLAKNGSLAKDLFEFNKEWNGYFLPLVLQDLKKKSMDQGIQKCVFFAPGL